MEANRVATDQRNNLSSKLRLRIGSSRHAWMDAMGTWSSIDTRRSNPGSTAIGTSTHHGKSTAPTRLIATSAASRKNTQHQAVHEASRQPTHGQAAEDAPHTHDTTKTFSLLSTPILNRKPLPRLHYTNQHKAATRTADASTLSR